MVLEKRNLSPLVGFNPLTVQPTASNYTGYDISVPVIATILFVCYRPMLSNTKSCEIEN
jgi:hypothetical protein